MGQTAIQSRMTVGLAGQIADFNGMSDARVNTVTNQEASAQIPFGVMLKRGTLQDSAKLPTTAADVLVGVSVLFHSFAEPQEVADTDAGGLMPGATFGVLVEGPVYVFPEAAVTPLSEVHVRIVASGGNTQLGAFTPTAEVAKTIDISAFAKWETSGSATVAAKLVLNTVNSALATAD